MNYPPVYNPYQPAYYPTAVPDQLAQLRQSQYQQPAPQAQQSNPIIWVQGEAGAKSYLTAPGNTVLLMDSECSSFYLKSSDASGMPLPLRIFDYTERTERPKTAQTAQNTPEVEYVTRSEFDALAARLDALTVKDKPVKTRQKEEAENG